MIGQINIVFFITLEKHFKINIKIINKEINKLPGRISNTVLKYEVFNYQEKDTKSYTISKVI